MHAAAQWTTIVVAVRPAARPRSCPARSTREAVWQAVQDEGVNSITVVGDAVGRPLWPRGRPNPSRWDVSSLFSISNGGAPMSPTLKARLAELFPGQMITDGFGSSEAGVQGAQRLEPGAAGRRPGAVHRRRRARACSTTTCTPVEPGSGVIGRVANTGHLPIGYLNDPEKTADHLRRGRRPRATASPATWRPSRPTARSSCSGRGSQCINTGGEKVFPEEVEAALRGPPGGGRRARGRRARRALGQRRHRRRAAGAAAPPPDPRRAARSTCGRSSPATSCRSTSCWSTRSCARRPARPTTAGREHRRLLGAPDRAPEVQPVLSRPSRWA